MTHSLPVPKNQIDTFCHRWKVAELSIHNFHGRTNDNNLRVFVRFDPVAEWNLTDRIEMEKELQMLSGRTISLRKRHSANIRKNRTNAMQVLFDA